MRDYQVKGKRFMHSLRFRFALASLVLLSYGQLTGQVGIQTDNPDPSAVLDIVASDKGVLIPRVTLGQSLSDPAPVSSPETGLLVFNIGSNQETGFYFWTGTKWEMLRPMGVYDVLGPDSSTDKAVVRFEGTSGKVIQNSSVLISDNAALTGVNSITTGGFTMPTGAGDEKVLVSDAIGNASWQSAHPLDVKESNILVAPNVNTLNFMGAVDVQSDGDGTASITIQSTLTEEQVIQVGSTSSMDVNVTDPIVIPWNLEMYKDVETFAHSNTSNSSRIQVLYSGTYEINYMFNIDNGSNQRKIIRSRLRVNGTDYISWSTFYAFVYDQFNDKATLSSSSFLVDLDANDYIEILVDRQHQNTNPVYLLPQQNLLFVRIIRSW